MAKFKALINQKKSSWPIEKYIKFAFIQSFIIKFAIGLSYMA